MIYTWCFKRFDIIWYVQGVLKVLISFDMYWVSQKFWYHLRCTGYLKKSISFNMYRVFLKIWYYLRYTGCLRKMISFRNLFKWSKILTACVERTQNSIFNVSTPFVFQWRVFLYIKTKNSNIKHRILGFFHKCYKNLMLFEWELVKLLDYKVISIFLKHPVHLQVICA